MLSIVEIIVEVERSPGMEFTWCNCSIDEIANHTDILNGFLDNIGVRFGRDDSELIKLLLSQWHFVFDQLYCVILRVLAQ
jgi:hypothetical protein